MAGYNELDEAMRLQTPLGRVRGLGSARGGTHHWWMQRVSSVALLPLTLWFVFGVASLAGAPYERAVGWIAQPFNAVLLLLSIGIGFQHTASGLQVVIDDYVRPEFLSRSLNMLQKGLCLVLALVSALAVLRIAV